jgi:hypothetical protein
MNTNKFNNILSDLDDFIAKPQDCVKMILPTNPSVTGNTITTTAKVELGSINVRILFKY